VAAVMFVTDSC